MKILEKIKSLRLFRNLIAFCKKFSLPGFSKIPIYDVLTFFIHGLKNGSLTTRASSMAFKFFLAIFPGIIFLFTLIPFIPIDNFQIELLATLENLLPENAYELTLQTIEDIIQQKHSSVLSLNFLIAVYFATNGMNSMIQEFNNSLNVQHKRSFLKQRLVSTLLAFGIVIMLIAAIALLIYSRIVIETIDSRLDVNESFNTFFIDMGTWVTLLLLFFFTISSIYYFGPSRKEKWTFFSPGATLASLLTFVTSIGFSFYVTNFSNYNKLYGSIGTLIVIMLWIYFNSLMLLIGFELNASLRTAKNKMVQLESD